MNFDIVFSGVGQSSVRNVRGMLPSPYRRRESPPKEPGSPTREKRSPVVKRNCRSRPGRAVKSEGREPGVLADFNQSTLDPVGPVAGASGDRFLKELNEMQDLEGDAGKESPDR